MGNQLIVTSPAFENEAVIPIQYTGRGEDISPELHLSAIRENAKSLAIIMDDMGHPIPAYNHWVIWNIPVMQIIPKNIPSGRLVEGLGGAIQGRGYGKNRYQLSQIGTQLALTFEDAVQSKELAASAEAHLRMAQEKLDHLYMTLNEPILMVETANPRAKEQQHEK